MALLPVVLLAALLPSPAFAAEAPRDDIESIYGEDDRRELDDPEVLPLMREAARSVAVVLPRSKVLAASPGDDPVRFRTLASTTYQTKYGLCLSERFLYQPAPGYCSAFLVATNRMVTAGHCLKSSIDCANTAFVFGFSAGADRPRPERVLADDVYYCRTILVRAADQTSGVDFTVFRLDRPVTGRAPLEVRRESFVERNQPMTVIGHPHGLPLKVSAGGKVRDASMPGYFVVDSDTFTGSSGSPVIDDATGLVEGVLVRGEADFVSTGSCNMIKRCAPDACRGEDVVRSSTFTEWVP